MSRPNLPVCDECGAVKREANHWWRVTFSGSSDPIEILHQGPLVLAIEPWCLSIDPGLDLCSEACVHQTVSKYLRGEFKNAV